MLAGEVIAGEGLADGVIADVRVIASNGGAHVTWEHNEVTDSDHRLAVTLDGDLVAVLPAGSDSIDLTAIADGEHRIEIHAIRAEATAIPDLHGADYGKTAFIKWPASSSGDLASYKVYQDSEHVATLDDIIVHGSYGSGPTSGTGTGRVSIYGAWTGATPTNGTFAVKVTSAGYFSHNMSGSWSTPRTFAENGSYELTSGVVVRFESPATSYDTDDQFSFQVGPPVSYRSDELDEGSHTFTVSAVDAAGNESATLTAITIETIYRPGDVTSLDASWDGTQIALSWALPSDGDLAAVLIYSNYSNLFATLQDDVIETGAWTSKASDATGHTFTPPASGTWKFYVRTMDTSGRISDNVEMLTVDTTAISDALTLSTPEAVTVTPIAGGKLRVSWQYPWTTSDDCTEFRIYLNADEENPVFTTPTDTSAATNTGTITEYSWDSDVLPGTRWATVRASDGTNETANTDLTEGEPDATAPTLSGSLGGTPN